MSGRSAIAFMKPSLHRINAVKRGSKVKTKYPEPFRIWKIVRGDKVHVISGKEKGKEGTVQRVNRKEQRVVVEGLNLMRKHIKGRGEGDKGKIIQMEAPMHYSNVMLVDPVNGQPTRIKMGFLEDGTRVRISKKSGAIIPKPDMAPNKEKPFSPDKDTPADIVYASTVSDVDRELHEQMRKLTLAGEITSPTRLREQRFYQKKTKEWEEKKAWEKGWEMRPKWVDKMLKRDEVAKRMVARAAASAAKARST